MSRHLVADGLKARRVITTPVGTWIIAFDPDANEWLAYPNDDYSNKVGLIACHAKLEEDVVAMAREWS